MNLGNKGVSALARQAGISTSTVSKKLLAGKTPEQVIREAELYRQRQSSDKKTDDDEQRTLGETYTQAQTRKEIALASMRELELAQKRGELVQLGQINAFIAGMIIKARDVLLRIAPELRDRLAQESDPVRCQELIDDEIHRALRQLSEYKGHD